MIEMKYGTIDDFFDSALETAKQIDEKIQITPKKSVWKETKESDKTRISNKREN